MNGLDASPENLIQRWTPDKERILGGLKVPFVARWSGQ